MSWRNLVDASLRDLRHTSRALLRRPAFAATIVLTLGLGLGSTVAIFSVVHSVLLTPLPFPEADRLVSVSHAAPGPSVTSGILSLGGIWARRKCGSGVDRFPFARRP